MTMTLKSLVGWGGGGGRGVCVCVSVCVWGGGRRWYCVKFWTTLCHHIIYNKIHQRVWEKSEPRT